MNHETSSKDTTQGTDSTELRGRQPQRKSFSATISHIQVVERYHQRFNTTQASLSGEEVLKHVESLIRDHDTRYESYLEERLQRLLPSRNNKAA